MVVTVSSLSSIHHDEISRENKVPKKLIKKKENEKGGGKYMRVVISGGHFLSREVLNVTTTICHSWHRGLGGVLNVNESGSLFVLFLCACVRACLRFLGLLLSESPRYDTARHNVR
jgi:hypothetical protein